MPTFKNVSSAGALDLILHEQFDDDGKSLNGTRFVTVDADEEFDVTDPEALLLYPQRSNFQPVGKGHPKGLKDDDTVVLDKGHLTIYVPPVDAEPSPEGDAA